MYDHQVTLVEDAVLSLAEGMPAEAYDFAPTSGEFAGVRSFGEQVKHCVFRRNPPVIPK